MRVECVSARFREIALLFGRAADSTYPETLVLAANAIVAALKAGRKILVFGNGGSASDAAHICGELVVRFQARRRALPALALTCDPAVITACANDFRYKDIFARQIEALGQSGDVALGISTSGTSPNVVTGLRRAREGGLITVLLTGTSSAGCQTDCDYVLAAPGDCTARIQEMHIASYHLICEAIDEAFAGEHL